MRPLGKKIHIGNGVLIVVNSFKAKTLMFEWKWCLLALWVFNKWKTCPSVDPLEERGCQLMAELLMPAAVTSLISGFSSRLWGYSLISGQSSRIWGILAFSKHTGNWRFYTLLVMFRRCVDPGYLNVRDSFSKSRQERPDPKNGAENRWSPGCGGCGCQGFVSKLGFGENGQKIAHNAATIPMDGNRWNGLIFAFAWRAADKRRPCLHCGWMIAPTHE